MDGRHQPRPEATPDAAWRNTTKNRGDPDTTRPLEDIMWNKISKSRQQDIIVITCGILLILLAKVLA